MNDDELREAERQARADAEAKRVELGRLKEAAREALVTMEHAQKFIGWKEKMHPTGQELYAETLANLRAVLGESE
jgi:hypothetical protein